MNYADLIETIRRLEEENAALHAENERLAIDSAFGCYSRAGLEARARLIPAGYVAVFGDVDGLHALNAEIGYNAADARIRHAIQATRVRHGDTTPLIGKYFSGDELVWCIPASDIGGFMRRVQKAFAQHGLSITLGYAVVQADGMMAAAARASAIVQDAKRRRDSAKER